MRNSTLIYLELILTHSVVVILNPFSAKLLLAAHLTIRKLEKVQKSTIINQIDFFQICVYSWNSTVPKYIADGTLLLWRRAFQMSGNNFEKWDRFFVKKGKRSSFSKWLIQNLSCFSCQRWSLTFSTFFSKRARVDVFFFLTLLLIAIFFWRIFSLFHITSKPD